jgi:hypothetical protein
VDGIIAKKSVYHTDNFQKKKMLETYTNKNIKEIVLDGREKSKEKKNSSKRKQ